MFWTIIVSCLNLLIYRFKALWIQLIHSKQCKTTTTYWTTHTIVRSANRTLDKLNISLNYVNVMNIVADVMRSTMHMVPLQAPTGQLEVILLQDISDFCICASVHYMRTYTSCQCCLTELKRSEVWLQWYITLGQVMQEVPIGSFTFDVLNHLWGLSAENNCSTSVLPWTCMDWPQTSI